MSPKTTLVANARAATAATGSYRFAMTFSYFETGHPTQLTGRGSGDGIVDIAHDRSTLTTTTGPERSQWIAIGEDRWVSTSGFTELGDMKPWLHIRSSQGLPAGAPLGFDPITLLSRLQARGETISRVGRERVGGVTTTHYAVKAPVPSTSDLLAVTDLGFDVWVDGHQLVRRVRLTSRYTLGPRASAPASDETVVDTVELFAFGVHADIHPPPADQVEDEPACPSPSALGFSGSLSVTCSNEGPTTTLAPVILPPPSGRRSTMQWRPVLRGDIGSCPTRPDNPSPDQPATLSDGRGGPCYELGRSELTIVRAGVDIQRDPNTGDIVADLVLSRSDADSLNAMARRNLGQRVAVVVFGRVVSAPSIQAAEFDGRAEVVGLDPQTAADLKASLSS